jgi:hypothetical protein
MYKILVEAHDLTEIQTEPTEFYKKTGENVLELMDRARSHVQNFNVRGGFEKYSLTIHLSRCK